MLGVETMHYMPRLDDYLRFVTVNFGLNGLMTERTPREVIEGYEDPLLQRLHDLEVYKGGDSTRPTTLALVSLPNSPINGSASFYTGELGDSGAGIPELTGVYDTWLGESEIKA